jgi:hypothetical protein
LVTYDLIKRKDYPELIEAFKTLYKGCWHCLGSVWIIKTTDSSVQVFKNLKKHTDNDDKLIVIKVTRDATWDTSFPDNCQAWLRANFD